MREQGKHVRAIDVFPGDYVLSIDGKSIGAKVADVIGDGTGGVRIEFKGRKTHYWAGPRGTYVRVQVKTSYAADGVTNSKAYASARAAAGI
jgi:hypothetical protein